MGQYRRTYKECLFNGTIQRDVHIFGTYAFRSPEDNDEGMLTIDNVKKTYPFQRFPTVDAHYITLQNTAVHCTLWYTTAWWSIPHYNKEHSKHCNVLQNSNVTLHSAPEYYSTQNAPQETTLQHAIVHCSTQQDTTVQL